MRKFWSRAQLARERGATLVEVALTYALIALSVIAVGTALMGDISSSTDETGNLLSDPCALQPEYVGCKKGGD